MKNISILKLYLKNSIFYFFLSIFFFCLWISSDYLHWGSIHSTTDKCCLGGKIVKVAGFQVCLWYCGTFDRTKTSADTSSSVSLPVYALLTLSGKNGEAKEKQMNAGQNNRRREQKEHFQGLGRTTNWLSTAMTVAVTRHLGWYVREMFWIFLSGLVWLESKLLRFM